jgi:hypothetical protein
MKPFSFFLIVIAASAVALFLLYGCSTPEPKIVTQIVKEAVPTPCNPKLDPRPALMTKDQIRTSLAAAPNIDDRVKILTTQVLLYLGWVPELEAGLNGCKGVPSDPKSNSGN